MSHTESFKSDPVRSARIVIGAVVPDHVVTPCQPGKEYLIIGGRVYDEENNIEAQERHSWSAKHDCT
ncbi:hypothetical protein SDC9_159772 [bioreactor metagenome]|uniref:Uncharacterized protein n=1 Tax=bioreactor metagenome TaxID=1076179 RepID=A0A645FJ49_9ZZZZ